MDHLIDSLVDVVAGRVRFIAAGRRGGVRARLDKRGGSSRGGGEVGIVVSGEEGENVVERIWKDLICFLKEKINEKERD